MKLSHCEKKNWNATNGLEVYRFNKKAKKSFRFHFDCFVFEISLEKKQLILHETSDFLHAVYMCFERTWSLPAVRVSPAKLITRTGENLAEDFRQNYEWQQLNLTDIGMFFQGNMKAKIPLWMSKNCPPTLIFFQTFQRCDELPTSIGLVFENFCWVLFQTNPAGWGKSKLFFIERQKEKN